MQPDPESCKMSPVLVKVEAVFWKKANGIQRERPVPCWAPPLFNVGILAEDPDGALCQGLGGGRLCVLVPQPRLHESRH